MVSLPSQSLTRTGCVTATTQSCLCVQDCGRRGIQKTWEYWLCSSAAALSGLVSVLGEGLDCTRRARRTTRLQRFGNCAPDNVNETTLTIIHSIFHSTELSVVFPC